MIGTVLLFSAFCLQLWNSYENFKKTQTLCLRVNELSGIIIHFDEVLTMSARMGAATGNLWWEERYRKYEPQLDKAIKETMELTPAIFMGEAAANTDTANIKLVAMENQAFDLINQGKREAANALLFSEEYEKQKRVYSEGMEKITAAMKEHIKGALSVQHRRSFITVASAFAILPILLVAWLGVVRIVGSYITERKKTENDIKEARDFLENIFKTSANGIIISRLGGAITMANEAAEKILGYSKGELIAKSTEELISEGKEKEEGNRLMARLMKEGTTSGVESVWSRKDGSLVSVELSAALLKVSEGDFTGTIISISDITERKEMENKLLQSEKLRSLGELAGGVAHDFNNVLAAILGRAQLLRMILELPPGAQERRKSSIELTEGLDVIEKASKDAAETVRRIQEFARSRDDDKYFTTINLNEIINSALDFTRMRWKDDAELKGIKINIQKELFPIPLTAGSAAELREVFTNLINNAIDAMPQGGDIKIKTFEEEGQVCIKIADTGVGIVDDIKGRIFDPFFTTKGVKSSGLGLSVSYGIINRHQGTITAESVEGEGASFTIKLPISEKILEKQQVKPVSTELRKAHILVIEDEEQVRNLLSAILLKGNHEVETATDGSAGIKMFEKKKFDLVFTDLGMPGMSGWQVAKKVKSINKRVPVVLITGWHIQLKESEVNNNMVDLILYKPFEVDQVLNVVQEGMLLRERFK